MVMLLNTPVFFGRTAVSHDGAAGSLNTLVLTVVSHDGAAGCFGYTGTIVLCTLVYFGALV